MKKSIAITLFAALMAAGGLALSAGEAPAGTSYATSDLKNVSRAIEYLRSRQQPDGGFAEPGHSSDMNTAWAVAAIASAGEDPRSWRKSGNSPLDFLARRIPRAGKLTDIEKVCLAVCSAGGDPRSFAGRDLVTEIEKRRKESGQIGEMLNEHIWALIALKAAGREIPEASRSWLRAKQNVDGGFGFTAGGESDPDDTGAAIQALIASGEPAESSAVSRALSYLRFCQADDGGFCWRSSVSNVASTAWAVQGIAAAGEDPGSDKWKKNGRTPLDFLAGMQQEDGHIKYMENNDSQPVWMTAEAIPALLKKPYPLNIKPQAKRSVNEPSTTPAPSVTPGEEASTAGDEGGSKPKSQGETTGDRDGEAVSTGNESAPEAEGVGDGGDGDKADSTAGKATAASVEPQDGKGSGNRRKLGYLALATTVSLAIILTVALLYMRARA